VNPASIIKQCRRAGIELFAGKKPGKIRWQSHDPLPRDLHKIILENKAGILEYLALPATTKQYLAMGFSQDNIRERRRWEFPFFQFSRSEARECVLTPKPPKPTRWDLLIDDYFLASECKNPRWHNDRPSQAQLALLRGRFGVAPPADATKGQFSFAISAVKRGSEVRRAADDPPAPETVERSEPIEPPKLIQPLNWFGGKKFLARRIVDLFPERGAWNHYCEPFFGGGAVLLANDPSGISEVVNDRNGDLTTFWRVLRDADSFARFLRIVQAVPFSESEWRDAGTVAVDADSVQRAAAFFIRCRQSFSGTMGSFKGVSKRPHGAMNENVSAWLNAIEGLPAVHQRLKRVLILNRDAIRFIEGQDGPRTLFYLDPPYLHSTRAGNDEYGQHEMSFGQHRDLLRVLAKIEGRFLLSGYPSKLYRRFAERHGWKCHEFDVPNNAAGGATKRRMIECVWTNY